MAAACAAPTKPPPRPPDKGGAHGLLAYRTVAGGAAYGGGVAPMPAVAGRAP